MIYPNKLFLICEPVCFLYVNILRRQLYNKKLNFLVRVCQRRLFIWIWLNSIVH